MRGSCLMTSITTLCILFVALGQKQVGDAAGLSRECVPLGQSGCGGFAGNQCCQNSKTLIHCQTPPGTADEFGTCCVPLGGFGCGGFAGFPCCQNGHALTHCQTPPGTADAFGRCVINSHHY